MRPSAPPTTTLVLLWLVVIVEIVSPIPLALSFGAIYVLLTRPPWFLELVHDLYRDQRGTPR